MSEPYIEVGRVAGPHGVAGKIRVKTHSGDPSGILGARTVRLSAKASGGAERVGDFEVETAQPRGGFAVFSLVGIGTPEEAGEWTGASVSVFRKELPPPEEGEFYWADLIGCEVVDEAGNRLGEIAGLEEGPAHDWIAVRREDGESLLPMVSAFIREVDVAGRRVVAAPPEGW
ncbi:MAG TPA: ribosome maturation factor RimM [Candidatus Deferrimicrobiaceae bacterium]|nr:ribosome maturation factor RimM [Candidatus Deferrimicrobiaceae bacterium]